MAEQIQHTPGPWEADDHGDVLTIHPRGANWFIAETGTLPSRVADARLIAAAPELLAALKEARGQIARYGYMSDARKLDSIIAKAEGREVTSHA